MRTGFHAGSAEVSGLRIAGASCALAGYQGFCIVCAELQIQLFVFSGLHLPLCPPSLTCGGGAWATPGLTFLHRSLWQHWVFV